MSAEERQDLLARSLQEYLDRRDAGERVNPHEFSASLGGASEEMLDVLEVEALLDDLLEPSPEEPLPRTFGPYKLLKELGRGAAGIVYEAEQTDLGRRDAVKVLRAESDADSTAWRRFRQEAQTLATVRHDHVVQIYAAGQVDGRSYYAMALLSGLPLDRWAQTEAARSPETVCAGLAGIADALHTLHERGIIHRDVKPSNILVGEDGHTVLADFGLARSLDGSGLTRTGMPLGTPLYMSPEQILGRREAIDGRTDVYGLGATLYHVLAGRPPFQADDLESLMRAVLSDRPPSIRRFRTDVPAACEKIALKALEKRPEDRYATAAEMAADLEAFARGERVHGRPVSRLGRAARKARRWWPAAAALLLLVVGGSIWARGRPGTLKVKVHPSASVVVDGTTVGTSPLEVNLKPGMHTLALRHEKFDDLEDQVEITAGQDLAYVARLAASNVNDAETVSLVASTLGLTAGPFVFGERHRGMGDAIDTRAVFPAGPVRIEDLDAYRIETWGVGEDAKLVFRVGDALIHEAPFTPTASVVEAPIPAAVLDQLKPGDVVTWGIDDPDSETAEQTFEVRPPDPELDARLAALEVDLAAQAPALRAYFLGRVLLERGFAHAAYRLGREAAEATPDALLTHGLVFEALRAAGLDDCVLADDILELIYSEAFTDAQRDAWLADE